ncbi:hypothetical protein [Clostridium sp. HBUAS56010]|uniref:hypothetical protein n=1 Tax=Clostridium sp. HBUAS56010 TaxID=2571127 RepID=UPI001177E1C7|nr:hypothetical protein [Clostridium sp. HBUAS56010]
MEEEMLIEILKEMQKKYQSISEIERITREIAEALSRNDQTTVQILLGMRQEEMDSADISEKNIRILLSVLTPEDALQIGKWLKGSAETIPENVFARKLVEKGKSLHMQLQRTIDLDRHINMRLAGKDSYYQ